MIKVAKDEWRYWYRSRLAMSVLLLTVVLALASVIVTTLNMSTLEEKREELQRVAEQTFIDQPDRHPHRMIHYGHYVFRTPPPLSSIDPGVDSFTGTSIFLEGHRQNGSSFSEQQQSTGLNWLGRLSPANVLQLLVPLLLIVIGYSVITREREAGTFTFLKVQGVSPLTLMMGKGLAMLLAGFAVMVPLIIGCIYIAFQGAEIISIGAFLLSYGVYIAIWCGLVLLVSTISKSNRSSFIMLICCWVAFAVVLPRIASNSATVSVDSPGKLETDFAVLHELRQQGDGHNSNDPAFKSLKANLLKKYDVERVEDLPVNFKGIVAKESEANLTEILNKYAEKSMDESRQQAEIARQFGWLSPTIAIQTLSMKLAGTDLENYHRFLREAEAVRFDFVQSLNEVHAEHITYEDDVNKGKSESARDKAKVDASNWKVLGDFDFKVAPSEERLEAGSQAMLQLIIFLLFITGVMFVVGRRV
jgi:ABC-2 type transport system permease protein